MDFNNIKEMLGFKREKCEKEIRVSSEAKGIIESPLVKQFFEDMEKRGYEIWKTSQHDDIEGRERVYQIMKLTTSFKQFFEKCIVDGKIAEQEIQNIVSGKYDEF